MATFIPIDSGRRVSVWAASAIALLAGSAAPLRAQTQDVDRAQLFREQTTLRDEPSATINPGDDTEPGSSPNDPDLGEQQILKRSERYLPFTLSVTAPFYYTSNVALVRTGEEGDFLFAPAASLVYAPRLTKALLGEVSVTQQYFRYNRFDALDFGSFDFRAGLTYFFANAHDLTLRAGYEYNRLTAQASFDEFFSNNSLFFNANLPFRLGRAQQISIGTDINISLAGDPEPPRREDFDAYVAYAVSVTRALTLDAVGRVAVHDYVLSDRVDVSEIVALSADYRVTKWLSASAVSTFVWNQSNHSVFDYQVANVGGAISLAVKF